MRLPTLFGVTLVALSGCYPFVSNNKYTEHYCELDEDGDGATKCTRDASGNQLPYDCNDANDAIFPDNAEVPYDGLDNDCVGGDVVDADGDKHPGIERAAYEALGGAAWPPGLKAGLDCNDDDVAINPSETETWYDGVDQDCGQDCDFNQDGDDFADPRGAGAEYCTEPATDCVDSRPDVFPGAPGEVPYDGFDQDCDGANDYDPDGDNDVWSIYALNYTDFLVRHGYTTTNPTFTECYDGEDSNLPQTGPMDPGTVNAAATEIPRDGIDGNCSDMITVVENDYDADDDGYMNPTDRTAFLAYVERYVNYTRHDGATPYKSAFVSAFGASSASWATFFDSHSGDCDDDDASRNPGMLEVLGDSVDQDCDGGNNTSPFVFGEYVWDGLGDVRVGSSNKYFMLVAAVSGSVTIGSGSPLGPRIAPISWELTADNETIPVDDTSYLATSGASAVYGGVGLTTFNTGYYASGSWFSGASTRSRTMVLLESTLPKHFDDGNRVDGGSVSGAAPHDEQDLRCDTTTGICWSVACGGGGFQVLGVPDTKAVSGFIDDGSTASSAGSVVDCFIDTEALGGTLLINTIGSTGSVASYTASGYALSPSSSSPFTSMSLNHASSHGDWLIFGKKAGGLTLYRNSSTQRSVLSGKATVSADAAFIGSTAYVAAVDTAGDVHLSFGVPTGSMTQVVVPFQDLNGLAIDAKHVTIEAAGSRVLIAATGVDASGDDALGWVFLEI